MPRIAALCATALLAGCAGPARESFTLAEQLVAVVPGIPDARAWGDAGPTALRVLGMSPEEVAGRRPGPLDYLALSSGGPAGAYGAGVLVGWTETGTRPEFDVVTGVSSGALLAPFAFVGPAGDAALRELWGGSLTEGLGLNPSLVGLLTGDGVVDPAPLRDLIYTYVNDDLVVAIARGHAEGRRLLVVTTNLDAQRSVVWNIGAIAASGQPGAAELLREVLLASASVPVAFPPVLIDTVAGTRPIREMHADGGVSTQIFALPEAALVEAGPFSVPPGQEATLWLLVSYPMEAEFGVTPGGTLGVGQRAYGALIRSDVRGDVISAIKGAEEAGFTVRLASIQRSPAWNSRDPFAASFLQELFELGHQAARARTAFQGAAGRS